jgi:uncharacterized protein YciI
MLTAVIKRSFSFSPLTQKQFVVIAKDFKDAECINRRLAVRPDHLARAAQSFEAGKIAMGGALVSDQGTMNGSIMIVDLPSKEAVEEFIRDDAYVKGRVWEHWEISEFKMARFKQE